MHHAPVVVHRILPSGGRLVTLRTPNGEESLGLARSDEDVIEFLRRAGMPDPDDVVLGGSGLLDWQGDTPHAYEADPPTGDLP
ncbi:hypothetical protein DEJ51_01270 [Streptomyces venezuelae]|uniref:Uncharacterized protein n=1 Tax=Streptomyces venezuelae TaxID=54571 RepID=A0A5P2DG06_STRVZ|nr:hypothetical protein [Streptomyces venezuelae]QES53058.1 hypothetical protein DEJ51_01270 [Streptomyces venezuelae]